MQGETYLVQRHQACAISRLVLSSYPGRLISSLNGLARFCLARFMIGANNSHSWGFEIGLDAPLQEIWESNKGEAILARRWVVPLT